MKKKDAFSCGALFIFPFLLFSRAILEGKTFLFGDIISQFYPFRYLLYKMGSQGGLFLWNPWSFSGAPLAANIQMALFYPLNLFFYFLPTDRAILFYVLFHIGLAGVFMYFFLRSFIEDSFPAFLGAFAYMFCGFVIMHTQHLTIFGATVWLPLILLLIDLGFRRSRLFFICLAALFYSFSILSGFPQISLYAGLLVFSYFIFSFFDPANRGDGSWKPARLAVFLLIFFIFSIGIAAVQLVPFGEYLSFSPRTGYEDKAFMTSLRMTFSEFPTYLFPEIKRFRQSPPGGDELIYLGIMPFLLMLLSFLKRDRRTYFWWGVGIFSILASLGFQGGLYYILQFMPFFSKMRAPVRFLFLFGFAISVLVGIGSSEFFRRLKKGFPLKVTAGILLAAELSFFAFIGMPTANPVFFKKEPEVFKAINKDFRRGRILTTTGLQTLFVNHGYLDGISNIIGHDPMVYGPYIDYIFYNDWGHLPETDDKKHLINFAYSYPIMKTDTPMIRLLNLGYIIRKLDMADPDILPDVIEKKDVYEVIEEKIDNDFRVEILLEKIPDPLPRAFFAKEYRIIPDRLEVLKALREPGFDPARTVFLEKDPGVGGSIYGGSVEIIQDFPDEMRIVTDAEKGGILFLSEVYYPGWQVYIDGKRGEILRANYVFRAVAVPGGKHILLFRYEPQSFKIGLIISILSLLILIGIILISRNYFSIILFSTRKSKIFRAMIL